MTGVRIRIEIQNLGATQATLAAARAAAERPKAMFDEIGLALVTSTQVRFERGEDPGGNPWPPSIRAQLDGGKTLIDSERLMQSITHEADDAGVAVGTNAIYAAVHQFGAVIRPVTASRLHFRIGGKDVFADEVEIPARPFLGLDGEDEKEIEAIAGRFLAGEDSDAD